MNIEYTPKAREELRGIRRYISQDNPAAADSVIHRTLQTIRLLGSFPLMGHDGRVQNTREFSVVGLPYFIVYDIPDATKIRILRVMHTSRRYP